MSQVFDVTRFLRLLRAHWAECWKGYAWFFGVYAVLNGICLVLVLQGSDDHQYPLLQDGGQMFWYLVGLMATGAVFSTRYFESFSRTGATLIQLMRPASVVEKWCLALFLVGILFPLAYTAVYACVNYPAVAFARAHYVMPAYQVANDGRAPNFQIYLPFIPSHADNKSGMAYAKVFKEGLVVVFFFWTLLATCMGGRVFFKRTAVLKTWLVVLALLLLGVCVDMVERHWLFANDAVGAALTESAQTFGAWDLVVSWATLAGVPLLLWIGLLLHIKEREVS